MPDDPRRSSRPVRAALAAYRPPMPFPVVVRYWDRGRGPDVLWTMPYAVDGQGRVLVYLAVGPAGQRVSDYLIADVDRRGLPRGSRVQICTEENSEGVTVYSRPEHTMN